MLLQWLRWVKLRSSQVVLVRFQHIAKQLTNKSGTKSLLLNVLFMLTEFSDTRTGIMKILAET